MSTADSNSAATAAAAVPEDANDVCVGPASEQAGKASSCAGCPNQAACASGAGRVKDPALEEVRERMSSIKHKLLVLSGKGGVGKSSMSAQLAWAIADLGFNVGILDIDICGPSIPRMLGVESHEIRRSNFGWSPVYTTENLGVMSIGFMLPNRDDAIIWRGPRKTGLIKQFLTDVYWGNDLDFLIIDSPPGTSDEHISITSFLSESVVDGAVIVTTPQEISLLDVRKEINFCKKVNLPVLGVIENMSGFVCPCGCNHKTDIFPRVTGGAEKMCKDMGGLNFLGAVPLDPQLLQACEQGKYYCNLFPTAPAVQPFKQVVNNILNSTPRLTATYEQHLLDQQDFDAQEHGQTDSNGTAAMQP